MRPSPLALLKPANPPGPVSAAKAPAQETARETETGARASPRTSVPRPPHWASRCRTKSRRPGGEAARQAGVGAPRGPGNCAQMPAPGLERLGVGRQENARAFVRVLPGTALFFTCTLPWTRRPLSGGGGAQNRRRGEACESCHAGVGAGRPQRVCGVHRRRRPPCHWTGGKEACTEGGLEARERQVMPGPLAPGLATEQRGWEARGRGGSRGRSQPSGGRIHQTRSGVPLVCPVRSLAAAAAGLRAVMGNCLCQGQG